MINFQINSMSNIKLSALVFVMLMLFFWNPSVNAARQVAPIALNAHSTQLADTLKVTAVPAALHYHTFYKKYINANGIPIIGSAQVTDKAFIEADRIVKLMLAKDPAIRLKLIENKFRIVIIGQKELTTDIPEYKDINVNSGTDWDERSRGFGASIKMPISSCPEENLLNLSGNRSKNNTLVHEFAHSIHHLALTMINPDFNHQLAQTFEQAKELGLWTNTYAITNFQEYFAVGVQCWFNASERSIPSNGIYNEIANRTELQYYDPDLYQLISLYFPVNDKLIIAR